MGRDRKRDKVTHTIRQRERKSDREAESDRDIKTEGKRDIET